MQSLKDKLLKAGLVSSEQAEAVEREKAARPARPAARAAPARPSVARAPAGLIPALPPLPGSKAHQRLEALKQQELDRQLRDLAHSAQVAREDGTRAFHFMTRKGKLRRLDLSEAQAAQLEKGELAVVESPEPAQIDHVLVPPRIAEQMLALSEKSVRFWNRGDKPIGFSEPGDS